MPQGQVLVVLELDWRTIEDPTSLSQGRMHIFGVRLGSSSNPEVFRSSVVIDADLAASGFWQGSASLAAGFEVHPGVAICPRAISQDANGTAVNSVIDVTVRGYLVKAK